MAVTSCCKTLFWRNVNKCLFNADRAATAQRKNSTQVWPGSPVSLLGLLFIGVTQVDVLLKRSPQHSQNLHPWNCPSQLSDSCTQRVLSMFHSLYSYPAGLGRHGSQRLPDSHEPLTFLLGECIHLEETAPWCIWQQWPPAVPVSHTWQQQCAGVSGERSLPWKSTHRAEEETTAMAPACPPLSC